MKTIQDSSYTPSFPMQGFATEADLEAGGLHRTLLAVEEGHGHIVQGRSLGGPPFDARKALPQGHAGGVPGGDLTGRSVLPCNVVSMYALVSRAVEHDASCCACVGEQDRRGIQR